MLAAMSDEDDRLGMTSEQWEIFQRLTHGYGEQDENGIDLSLLRQNLTLTPLERLRRLQAEVGSLRRLTRERRA